MATNLRVDPELIAEAMKLGHHRSKSEAMNAALGEYVETCHRLGIPSSAGWIGYVDEYDRKNLRAWSRESQGEGK